MENEIIAVLNNYAFPVIVMSAITMIIVGILKTPIKTKLKAKEKYSQLFSLIVMTLTVGVIVAVVAVYRICIAKLGFVNSGTLKDIGSVFLLTQTLYMIYKKYGRKGLVTLWELITAKLKSSFANKGKTQSSIDIASAIIDILTNDLDEIMLEANCPLLTESQKESLHAEFRRRAETAIGITAECDSYKEATVTNTQSDSSNADNNQI
ncbi:MAG: hypothetical protein OSJ67_07590 [Clostridia bacterium]|nr:hypothetical protein [Clostridia bacterium]